jgi:DNA segregation ATPase FtsK/SpoIIIE, S-DNA-T family
MSKAKPKAKAKIKGQKSTPSLAEELVVLFGFFLAIYLLICLVSYSLPIDSEAVKSIAKGNWGGSVGYFLAHSLMSFLGLSSFWLIILLIFFSFQLFAGDYAKRLPYIVAGTTGIIFSSSSLLATFNIPSITVFFNKYPLGGTLGDVLYANLGQYFGRPGFTLFFLAVLLSSLMVSVRFSPYFCAHRFWDGVCWMYKRLVDSKRKRKEKKLKNELHLPEQKKLNITDDSEQKPIFVPHVHETVKLEDEVTEDEKENEFHPLPESTEKYRMPSFNLLNKPENQDVEVDREHYYEVSKELEKKLADFGVKGKVIGICPGPVITTYEFSPAPGVKISKVVSLAEDLALGLKTPSVRIVGSIPGKSALGIEVPNPARQFVYLRDILSSDSFQKHKSRLALGLGMDVIGKPVIADLSKMPHLLIAGATGAGKSVAINTIVTSILYKSTPEEVRLLMVDPKRIELSCYESIPHLLHPVVVDPKLASRALNWAVREMERRYELMEESRTKNIANYNEVAETRLPLIVIIIDELADLMMVASKEVEDSVARLAQMARAAGMHLILATQRPSVDVLTGLIKANFPTRMSFKVSSKIDSRTILDSGGAEHLLGAGDMLFLPPGTAKIQRIHGAYIDEFETEKIVDFIKSQSSVSYDEAVMKIVEEEPAAEQLEAEDYDEKYDEAVAIVCESGQASISMVQRRLRIGYNRAARMIEVMEREGIIGPADGAKPREVLVRRDYS